MPLLLVSFDVLCFSLLLSLSPHASLLLCNCKGKGASQKESAEAHHSEDGKSLDPQATFTVWLHHFFTIGASANVNAFFGIMTMIIVISTGVKIFNWLFTIYKDCITFATPMMWLVGFMIVFSVGGMTGVLLSVPGVDSQMHNSAFLIAHFHKVIIGGVVFGAFVGLTF